MPIGKIPEDRALRTGAKSYRVSWLPCPPDRIPCRVDGGPRTVRQGAGDGEGCPEVGNRGTALQEGRESLHGPGGPLVDSGDRGEVGGVRVLILMADGIRAGGLRVVSLAGGCLCMGARRERWPRSLTGHQCPVMRSAASGEVMDMATRSGRGHPLVPGRRGRTFWVERVWRFGMRSRLIRAHEGCPACRGNRDWNV